MTAGDPWPNYTFQVRMDRGGYVFELFSPPGMLPVDKSGSHKTHAQATAAASREIQRRRSDWLERNKGD